MVHDNGGGVNRLTMVGDYDTGLGVMIGDHDTREIHVEEKT